MNIKDIKSLIQLMENSSLTLLEVSENDLKIRLQRNIKENSFKSTGVQKEIADNMNNCAESTVIEKAINFNQIKEIKSPMVGIFYEAGSPQAEPFVTIGSKVKKGDILCVIEAMKVMNEITAEIDGEIVDICAKNGELVEYSQTLFKIF